MKQRRFDRRQYFLLLRLLRDLGSRREVRSQFGLDGSAMYLAIPFFVLLGGGLSLITLAHPPARVFEMLVLGMTVFFVVPLLLSEAADALMNPVEMSVLVWRPIHSASYAAAKLTYLLRAALAVSLPINAVPAFAGLVLTQTRWFYPLTHLAAATLLAVFTALLVFGACGLLFRFVAVQRIRSAATWMQLAGAMALPLLLQLIRHASTTGQPFGGGGWTAPYWSAVPVTWFACLGLGWQASVTTFQLSWGIPAGAIYLTGVVLGARTLSRDYMIRIGPALHRRQARDGGKTARARRRVPRLPGRRSAWATSRFIRQMALRDWQFRRAFLQVAAALVIVLGSSIARSALGSPLGVRGLTNRIQLAPHLFGMLSVIACSILAYSDYYRASWVFTRAPNAASAGIARGIVATLWCVLIGVPALLCAAFVVRWWGVLDTSVFTLYGTAVASTYFGAGLWLIDGVPFTLAPRSSRGIVAQGVMMTLMVVFVVVVGLQAYFIMPNRIVTTVAGLALALLAGGLVVAALQSIESHISICLATGIGEPQGELAALSLGARADRR